MEEIPEQPIYSEEKFNLLKERYNQSELLFSEEAESYANYLREKYPNFAAFAFYHILGGSTIDEEGFGIPIAYEDFPGNDSVETFIDNPEKYKLG